MTLRLRRYLFLLFVSFFIIGAPLIIGYTAGYRLNLTNRRVSQTGAVAISSYPKGAKVILNNLEPNQKTPTVIQRVAEGEAQVQVSKAGFHDWNGKITVPAGQTAYITVPLFSDEPISLLPQAESLLVRAEINLKRQTATLPTDITLNPTAAGIEITKTSPLSQNSETLALIPSDDYRLVVADRDYLIFKNGSHHLFLIDRNERDVVTFDEPATAFEWNNANKLLLWTDGYEIHTYDAETHTKTLITRQSEQIISVNWNKNLEAIIFTTANKVTAIDRQSYLDGRFSVVLYSAPENQIITDAWTGTRDDAYYLITAEGTIALPL